MTSARYLNPHVHWNKPEDVFFSAIKIFFISILSHAHAQLLIGNSNFFPLLPLPSQTPASGSHANRISEMIPVHWYGSYGNVSSLRV